MNAAEIAKDLTLAIVSKMRSRDESTMNGYPIDELVEKTCKIYKDIYSSVIETINEKKLGIDK